MEVVYTLIQAGFSQHEVLHEMTPKQVVHFFEIAQKQRQELMQQQCIATRVAHHGDNKTFDKFIKGK